MIFKFRSPLFCCLFIVLLTNIGDAQEVLFKSNQIGQILKKIDFYRSDEFDWILKVTKKEGRETKRLFFKDELKKEWIIDYYNQRTPSYIKKSDNENILEETFYNISGNEVEEREFTDGKINRKTLYFYNNEQRVSRKEIYDNDNKLLYEEFFKFTAEGRIRSVEQRWDKDVFQRASFVFGEKGLVLELYESDDKQSIIKYDEKGDVQSMESYKGDELIESTNYEKIEGNRLQTVKKDPDSGLTQVRTFNNERQLLSEITRDNKGEIISELHQDYNSKKLRTQKQIKGPKGLIEEKFEYDDNDDLRVHSFFERGSVVKIIRYPDEVSRNEEYYRKNKKFLIAYFKDNKKMKEELYSEDKLIKERSFE